MSSQCFDKARNRVLPFNIQYHQFTRYVDFSLSYSDFQMRFVHTDLPQNYFPSKNNFTGDFPGSPVVKFLHFQSRQARVQSLVRELRSHMPCGVAKQTEKTSQNLLLCCFLVLSKFILIYGFLLQEFFTFHLRHYV